METRRARAALRLHRSLQIGLSDHPALDLVSSVAAGIAVMLAIVGPAEAQFQITPSAAALASADGFTSPQSSQPETAEATAFGSFRLRGQSKGYGRAALATGGMEVRARSVAGGFASPGGSGRAQLEDEITITGPTGAPPVLLDVRLRVNGFIDLGPTSSFEGTTASGTVSNFTRGVLSLMANSGPLLGDSVTGEVRQTASGSFSEGPNSQLQSAYDVFLQELPYNSPFVGSAFGFVSFDSVRTNRFGLEEIVTIPITVRPGDRFRLTAIVETAAYSSQSYVSYANFYDSSLLDLELPPGYGFISTSGILLSQAVPEPTVTAMLAVGGLAIVCAGRRRSPAVRCHSRGTGQWTSPDRQ